MPGRRLVTRALRLIVINLVVFCLAAEALGLAVFYYEHGWLFYSYPYARDRRTVARAPTESLTSTGLHPYFGPTHRPGIPFDIPEALRGPVPAVPVLTNNFGFVSPHQYPFVKTHDRQYIIGIFGGSVGAWFCQVGADRLMHNLSRRAFFRDRELIPLCFSHEGYKQPQQALVLAYFLSIGQTFDLVIGVDGFNEVALGSLNAARGWDPSMPSVQHLDPIVNLVNQATLTPAKLELLASISRDRRRLDALAERVDRARLASSHLVLERYYAWIERRLQRAQVEFDRLPSSAPESSLIHVTPPVRSRDEAALFADIASAWLSAERAMRDLLAGRAVPYRAFLQPNQYYTARQFSDDEAAVALLAVSPFKPGVEKGYPAVLKMMHLDAGSADPVDIVDATGIFDREPAPVYIDNCCHYTRRGNELLADFIASAILRSPGAWQPSGRISPAN